MCSKSKPIQYAVQRPIFSYLAAPRLGMMKHRKYSENSAINHRDLKRKLFQKNEQLFPNILGPRLKQTRTRARRCKSCWCDKILGMQPIAVV